MITETHSHTGKPTNAHIRHVAVGVLDSVKPVVTAHSQKPSISPMGMSPTGFKPQLSRSDCRGADINGNVITSLIGRKTSEILPKAISRPDIESKYTVIDEPCKINPEDWKAICDEKHTCIHCGGLQ